MPLAGAPRTLCQEPQEASQRHLWELVTWCRDSVSQRDAVSLGRKSEPAWVCCVLVLEAQGGGPASAGRERHWGG